MSGSENTTKDDAKQDTGWRIEEPDEEKYNFSGEKGLWQPKPEDILSFFEKLAKGGPLPLKWTCSGRRPPMKDVKPEENEEERMDFDEGDSKEDDSKTSEMSAFDFNEPHLDANAKLTPRRAPGGLGRTPRTEKRVARMDNIMKSLQQQQLQRAAEREARKAKGSPSSGTPGGRGRLSSFGSPGPKSPLFGHTSTSGLSTSKTVSSSSSGSSSSVLASSKSPPAKASSLSAGNSISKIDFTADLSSTTKVSHSFSFHTADISQKTDTSVVPALENNKGREKHKDFICQWEILDLMPDLPPTSTQLSSDFSASASLLGLQEFCVQKVASIETSNLFTNTTNLRNSHLSSPIPAVDNVSLDKDFESNDSFTSVEAPNSQTGSKLMILDVSSAAETSPEQGEAMPAESPSQLVSHPSMVTVTMANESAGTESATTTNPESLVPDTTSQNQPSLESNGTVISSTTNTDSKDISSDPPLATNASDNTSSSS